MAYMEDYQEIVVTGHHAHCDVARIEVMPPQWAHRIRDRREARIGLHISGFYGGMILEDAIAIYEALGKAIELARPMKLERPRKEPA